ncbi:MULTISPECIES: hypothetical protein [unclassified Photobacterium]|uniref:hypothetical protein n=1 Tax=unclassified Photobacterium TaxID=2628852 RepID=UPI0011B24E88|nr:MULTISPECIES: hypothetical protein [unclassified Photobacterium]
MSSQKLEMMMRFFCILFLFTSTFSYSENINVEYNIPMYLGTDKYNDFSVVVDYKVVNGAVDIKSNNEFKFPGKEFLSKTISNFKNKEMFYDFINKNRKQKYSDEMFSLIYRNSSWLRESNSILLEGYSQIGDFVFYVLSVEGSNKVISLEKTKHGYQFPDVNENKYSYIIPLYALIKKHDNNFKNNNINKDFKRNCIVKKIENSCNLFLIANVEVYENEIKSELLMNFFDDARGLQGDDSIDKLFSSDFLSHNKASYLSNLLTLNPMLSIELSNSIIFYFGHVNSEGIKISKIVKFKKENNNIYITDSNRFNLVDSTISDSDFIHSLLNK